MQGSHVKGVLDTMTLNSLFLGGRSVPEYALLGDIIGRFERRLCNCVYTVQAIYDEVLDEIIWESAAKVRHGGGLTRINENVEMIVKDVVEVAGEADIKEG
jgi:hypothetical protein